MLLSKVRNDDASTFINANWVSGFNGTPNVFIATQGPLPTTTSDFWYVPGIVFLNLRVEHNRFEPRRMVWEHGVEAIVMVTNVMEVGVCLVSSVVVVISAVWMAGRACEVSRVLASRQG